MIIHLKIKIFFSKLALQSSQKNYVTSVIILIICRDIYVKKKKIYLRIFTHVLQYS